jgi:hypothetical protein
MCKNKFIKSENPAGRTERSAGLSLKVWPRGGRQLILQLLAAGDVSSSMARDAPLHAHFVLLYQLRPGMRESIRHVVNLRPYPAKRS